MLGVPTTALWGRQGRRAPQQLPHCTDTNMGAQGGEWTCPGSQTGHVWANCPQCQCSLPSCGLHQWARCPEGVLHYQEDPADTPSQDPLTSLGGIQLEGPARPPSTGKGSECLSRTKTSIQTAVTQSSERWGREQSMKTPQRRQLMQAEGGEELNGGNSERGKWEIFKMREEMGKRTLRHNLISWGHLNL